jgi:hypothetical protein
MQNILEYLTPADMQIYINRDEHIYLNLKPNKISYFKFILYVLPTLFKNNTL